MGSVHDEKVVGKIFEWRLYKRFLPFARPYLGWFALSVFLLLLLSVFTMGGPLIVRQATGIVLGEISTDDASATSLLTRWALIYIGLAAATFALRLGQLWISARTGQHIVYDVRNHIFQHLQRRNLRFFDTNPVGKLVTRVTSDIEALAELFSSGIDVIFYDIVMLGLTLGLLFWISPHLALLTLALLPFVAVWSFRFKRKAQDLFRKVRARITRLNSFINETITGMRVVQIFRAERRVNRRFQEWDGELKNAHRETIKNFALFYPGIEVLSSLGTAVIAVAGHNLVTGGHLGAKDLVFFWFMLHKFFEPLRQISEKYNVLQSAMASAERLAQVLDDERSIPNAPEPNRIPGGRAQGRIEFDDVHFSYDGRVEVLKGISFKVEPGEQVAIVGHTGAGKSSLINVLGRFYDVTQGRILLDDIDIRELDKHELRRSIGIVLQDVFLFADTLRENLRLGDESIDDETLMRACRTVLAEDFVNSLPGGLDFEVQERGATFSQGQKQLIAFARTVAHDPPVLVLDEATSSVDTATEQLIQQALESLMSGRTVLVIAHRLSTIKKAARILVMHHGELVEEGSHRDLLKRDGVYRKLYELQYAAEDKRRARTKGTG